MAYRVIDGFLDKKTGKYHKFGEIIETDERIDDFLKGGVVINLDEEEKEGIAKLTVPQIKEKLEELGIDYEGKTKKKDLLELLEGAD